MCEVFEVSQGLQNLKLFELVVGEVDLRQIRTILQNLQTPTQSVTRELELLQVFQFGETPEVCDGGVAEVEGLEVGELAVEALNVNVPASLHSAQVQIAHLKELHIKGGLAENIIFLEQDCKLEVIEVTLIDDCSPSPSVADNSSQVGIT